MFIHEMVLNGRFKMHGSFIDLLSGMFRLALIVWESPTIKDELPCWCRRGNDQRRRHHKMEGTCFPPSWLILKLSSALLEYISGHTRAIHFVPDTMPKSGGHRKKVIHSLYLQYDEGSPDVYRTGIELWIV